MDYSMLRFFIAFAFALATYLWFQRVARVGPK